MTDSEKTFKHRFSIIAILILAVYANVLGHGFVWDDLDVIVNNPLLQNLNNLPRLLLSSDRLLDTPTGYYRPLTYISFLIDRGIWGLNPFGFNLTNLILHISVALLFYSVVSALFKREKLAFFAALIFSLHPVAGETVNFHAGGRNTLLSACFALLSLLFYMNRRRLPAILCFAAAIFSKEFALLLPLVFLFYDKCISMEKKEWSSYLPFSIPIIIYLTLRSFAVENGNLLRTIQLSDNLLAIPQIVVNYFINMAFPLRLKTVYDVSGPDVSAIAIYSLALLAIIGTALAFRKIKEISFSFIWFFLFLLPVTNIFPLGIAMMADRYAYFSLMGFSILLAYCICKANDKAVVAIVVILCAVYATIDVRRNSIWADDLSLYTQVIKDAPEKYIGFYNLGIHYYKKGDLANAERYLTEACAKKDATVKNIHALVTIYWENGKLDQALIFLDKAIALDPDNPQSYVMASRMYETKGDKAMAKSYLDKAVAKYPQIVELMDRRTFSLCREGEMLMAGRKYVEAEKKFKEALMMKPDFVPALIDMGSLAAEKGELAKSIEYFTRAEGLDPLNPSVHYNLSVAYELMGRSAEAQEEMKKFTELDALARQKADSANKPENGN